MVHKTGDQVVAAEARGLWIRLSENGDEWGKEVALDRAHGRPPRQAWMLTDGAELRLGTLLEEVNLEEVVLEATELSDRRGRSTWQ